MGTPTREQEREDFSIQMEVSNAMVRIYKEQFGRGPTKCRTNFAGPNTLISTLEDTLTPAERTQITGRRKAG